VPRASGDQRLKREVAELRRADESSRRRLLSSRPSSTGPSSLVRFMAEHAGRSDGGLRWGVKAICAVLSPPLAAPG